MVDEVILMFNSLLKDEKGQAVIEMAIVAVLLMLLLFGITEFGRLFYYSLTINNGARAGARAAAVVDMEDETDPDDPDEQLKEYIAGKIFPGNTQAAIDKRAALVNNDAAGGNIDVVYYDFNGVEALRIPAGLVDITINYPVPVYAPFISIFTGNPRTVSAHVVMQIE